MAYKPAYSVLSNPAVYASNPVPSLEDFTNLWTLWDGVTRHMIPKEELLSKPIKLRNACIFYLGHIPTFSDIHLSRATGKHPAELDYYQKIFERGIDPDVDNPELCHDHSEIPDTWPPVEDILVYQTAVRERVKQFLTGEDQAPALRKALWIGYEHEAMHLETLLYMLVQSEKTLPPPGVVTPDFEAMAAEADIKAVRNEWVKIPANTITFGIDATDGSDTSKHMGWDNESPVRTAKVHEFMTRTQPITNREYVQYLVETGTKDIPASWMQNNTEPLTNGHHAHTNGTNGVHINGTAPASLTKSFIANKSVRTAFGALPLLFALDWPVMASYTEITGCAAWLGGRIPTFEEVHSIYQHVESSRLRTLSAVERMENIPAVNSHLSNDGVEETPPKGGLSGGVNGEKSSSLANNQYVDLEEANVGFKAWHPVPVTDLTTVPGQGEIGGVWEWTSTVLEPHQGFEAMELYPGYTCEFYASCIQVTCEEPMLTSSIADFFDGKHNIVLGGSWATVPRIAGRKSFVNWYQRNYPYVWAGARLVKDI
jgi:formylglycine-generating enzyme required for sulfatase activity